MTWQHPQEGIFRWFGGDRASDLRRAGHTLRRRSQLEAFLRMKRRDSEELHTPGASYDEAQVQWARQLYAKATADATRGPFGRGAE